MTMRLILRPISFFARYKVPYNINKQQHAGYLQKVARSQQQLKESQKVNLVPRRKRRIYDRPRIDDNIEGYGAWRVFQQQQLIRKYNEHNMQVALKIQIQPKWLIHAFGMGHLPLAHHRSAHREYYFQDNRLNSYLLYEYRNTTDFKPNKQNYDYDNQQHLHPRVRIYKRISPEQFWQSQQKFEFRLNTTLYAEKFKFKNWLLSEIEKKKSQKSYDQYIDETYGKCFTFNKKEDSSKFVPLSPMLLNVTPETFSVGLTQKKEKGKKEKEKVESQKISVNLSKKMDEKYRIKDKLTVIEQKKEQSLKQ